MLEIGVLHSGLIEEVRDDAFHGLIKLDIVIMVHRIKRAVRNTTLLSIIQSESVQKIRVNILCLFV